MLTVIESCREGARRGDRGGGGGKAERTPVVTGPGCLCIGWRQYGDLARELCVRVYRVHMRALEDA